MASCSIPQYEQHLTEVSICLERILYQWSKGVWETASPSYSAAFYPISRCIAVCVGELLAIKLELQ